MKESRAQFIRRSADELKRQREALGLSLAEVGEAVDASASVVALWEKGQCMMSAYSAMLLKMLWRRKWAEREQEALKEQMRGEAAL